MVMISVLVLLGLGLVTATVLAVASRVFHVEEDPRVQAVLEACPARIAAAAAMRAAKVTQPPWRRTPPCPRTAAAPEVRKQASRWAN